MTRRTPSSRKQRHTCQMTVDGLLETSFVSRWLLLLRQKTQAAHLHVPRRRQLPASLKALFQGAPGCNARAAAKHLPCPRRSTHTMAMATTKLRPRCFRGRRSSSRARPSSSYCSPCSRRLSSIAPCGPRSFALRETTFSCSPTRGDYMHSNNSCFTPGSRPGFFSYGSGKCDAVIASGARVPTNLSTGQNRSE